MHPMVPSPFEEPVMCIQEWEYYAEAHGPRKGAQSM